MKCSLFNNNLYQQYIKKAIINTLMYLFSYFNNWKHHLYNSVQSATDKHYLSTMPPTTSVLAEKLAQLYLFFKHQLRRYSKGLSAWVNQRKQISIIYTNLI